VSTDLQKYIERRREISSGTTVHSPRHNDMNEGEIGMRSDGFATMQIS